MFIKEIKLSNFKNFEDVNVSLSDFNVLVGANASGKSNFIQSLKFIKDICDYGIENAISLHGGLEYLKNAKLDNRNTKIGVFFHPTGGRIIENIKSDNSFLAMKFTSIYYEIIIKHKRSNQYSVNEFIKYIADLEEIQYSNNPVDDERDKKTTIFEGINFEIKNDGKKTKFKSNLKKNTIKLRLSNGEIFKVDKDKITPFYIPFELINLEKKQQQTILEKLPNMILPGVSKIGIYDFDLKTSKRPITVTGKVELEHNGENIAIVIKNILNDKEKTKKLSNLLSDILPFIEGLNVEKYYDKSLLFKVKEIYHTTSIPSSLLSDGTVSIITLIVALFFENKLLGVFEEPEQGIHPSLIAKLMSCFYDASRNKQIIITTHNPEIVRHTKLEDLSLVSRNQSGFSTISRPQDNSSVKAFLENELGVEQLFIQNLL